MTAGEQRQPRESYTRTLMRICEKLDSQDTYELDWKDRLLHRRWRSLMRADSLWVVGSYARGAATCGDLDLVLKMTCVEGVPASAARFSSKAFRFRGVRCYGGDPNENTSGVHFPEAIHIWSKDVNWRRAIESIPIDPSVGRFARPSDEIPLRLEQLYDDLESTERVIKRRMAGEISWRFVPIDPAEHIALDTSDDWEHKLTRLFSFSGKATQKLLPYLLRYLRENCSPPRSRAQHESTDNELQFEGTFVTMGRASAARAHTA